MDLIRRSESFDKSFDDLQNEMAEAVEASMALDGLSAVKPESAEAKPADAAQPAEEIQAGSEQNGGESVPAEIAVAADASLPIQVDLSPVAGEAAMPPALDN